MLERVSDAPWLPLLLDGLYRAQVFLLRLLHQLGLVESVHGQPAWPWAYQLSGDNLLIDVGHARQFGLFLLAAALGLVLLLAALLWRRGRPWLAAAAVALLLWLAPWPSASVVLQGAHPTSFHTSPVPFSDAAIAQGAAHYARLCQSCHGARGDGQGPLAARQPVWPPSFAGPLLWRRSEGQLFWAIQHGMHTAAGAPSMPAFGAALSDEQAWEVLHYLRALGAGQLLRLTGNWAQPIRLPDMQLRCVHAATAHRAAWRNQRIRLATADPARLIPDPRMLTFWLPAAPLPPSQPIPDSVDCVVTSVAPMRLAVELINGGGGIEGLQLLADRSGWLRARNGRGAAAWSDDDLLCRSETGSGASPAAGRAGSPAEDGLSRLIRTMDETPVRFIQGGRVH